MGNLQSSPSSSTTTPEEKYDVFLSFRGKDTRYGFTNNLYEALEGKKIKTFMDDQLRKGDKISEALLKTIEESKISIVIFSKDYGSTNWCLEELVKIMELNKINKQTVVPVFYGVEPFHVRYQTGSFEDSFVKHEIRFPDEVQKWREALKEASLLSGYNSYVTRPDTKLVTAIVDDIDKKLAGDENISSPSDFKGLIGLDERIKHVKSLLCLHETEVRIIGILGMGGIGKTTLARVIFKQISSHQFEGVCFIQDVREKLVNSRGLDHLQEEILSKVLNDKQLKLDSPGIIPPRIKKRLKQTKVLIVLDDVDDFSPLQNLASGVDTLGQGSRIIITSRDKLVLLNCEVDDQNIYEVKEFNHCEALQLFCNRAFNQNQPTEDLRKLSNDIVNYAGGNPLALMVFGSSLRGSSLNQESKKKVWETTVDKLRTNFNSSISKKLEISYDGLEDEAKGVFLDIACFLKGRDRDYVASILDDCDCWLEDLIHKSLITVSHKTIQMHDLLQDLGRDIVRKQYPTDLGKRSRLWALEDIQQTLKHDAGTVEVQGIFLDMSDIIDMRLSPKAFKKMLNLRLLKFYNYQNQWEWGTRSYNKVQFREGLNNAFFENLRSFIWHGYPLTVPSSNFSPDNLVELDLSNSNLERLWDDIKPAPKLRWLILHHCLRLTEIPDLSKSPLLERIDLSCCLSLTKIPNLSKLSLLKEIDLNGCSSLTKIPNLSDSPLLETIEIYNCRSLLDFPLLSPRLNNLSDLNLWGCESLRSFPSNIHFESLESLNLSGYINLTTFPHISGNIKDLFLSGTAIDEVPPSIENLIQLSHLDLSECTRLKQISTNICKLKSLYILRLHNCSQLESFPEILDKMEDLEFLHLSGTAIKELPHSIEHLTNLLELDLSGCKNLEKLPSCTSLIVLDISDCPKFEILPYNLGNLKSLEYLSIDGTAIRQLLFKMMPCSLTTLSLKGCNLKKIPEHIGCLSSLKSLELSGNNFESLPKSIKQLCKLKRLKMNNCNMLQSLTELPSALKHLSASGCQQLQSIPDASEFANLVRAGFIFTNCLKLKETVVGNMLATLKKGYEEGDEIGKLAFCFPGSKAPGWFYESSIMDDFREYEGGSVFKIKFQIPWQDCFVGFAVYAVIVYEECCIGHDFHGVEYKYKYSDGDESSPHIMNSLGTSRSVVGRDYIRVSSTKGTLIHSDHIVFGFCKTSVPQVRESDFGTFEFGLAVEKRRICRMKSFGVCPIFKRLNITLPSSKKQKT